MASQRTIRQPAVAGRFYPGNQAKLESEVADFLERGRGDAPTRPAAAVMAPHAGYVYSGGIAGQVFARIDVPERVVVLCPNHTGMGRRIAVVTEGAFRIPGLDIPIDEELAGAIMEEVSDAAYDREAHRHEHAIEVELPFLAARQHDLRIVPIVLGGIGEKQAVELGKALARAVASTGHRVLVVASSDMSHYLPDAEARKVDNTALEPLLAFDPNGLYRTVTDNNISMCGYIPATAMLSYAQEVKSQDPELVGYATSGDAFGDYSRVVGYAGVALWSE
jgi:AmmeMemoRadiSam system protein B